MTYTPSETEKSLAAMIQLASLVLFFIPALVIRQTRWRRSPYIRLWAKANMLWSFFLVVPTVTLYLLGLLVGVRDVFVVTWSAHAMMVIVCAFASMFNRPIGYFIITNRYCRGEMADVFGAAVFPPANRTSRGGRSPER